MILPSPRPKAVPKLVCALLTMYSDKRDDVIDQLIELSDEDWKWVVDRYVFWDGMSDIISDIQVLRDLRD